MQKTRAFYLLPFALLLAACSFNPNMQGNGQGYLQGEWQQDSVPMQKRMLNYSLYKFRFSCDSFFVSMQTFSKVNPGADSCMKAGQWTEFAKGDYQQKNDTLHLKGLFANANWSLKDPGGCFRSGVYEEFFKITKKTDSLVQFFPTSSVIPISARLVKRSTCTPKPL
jgi:hypothetical protein